MSELESGAQAPDFTLPGDDGGSVSLAELRGRPVVVYFYPKADTPGCTTEALDFTARKQAFTDAGVTVVAISPDPVRKIARFRDKHDLGVVLASDEDHAVADAYGVWVEKSMYGRTYMGIERSTFLIAADGAVARVWRKVKVKGHAEEVLDAARALA